jgi:hypothetical protein
MNTSNKQMAKLFTLFLTIGFLFVSVSWADDTYLDKFDSVSYSNNDGTKNFANDWTEQGDDGSPSGGDIIVESSGFLQFNGIGNNDGISRKLDLSWVSPTEKVVLTFDYDMSNMQSGDWLTLQLYDRSNSKWVGVKDFNSASGTGSYSRELESKYISADSALALANIAGNNWASSSRADIDNVKFTVYLDTDGDGVLDVDDIDDDNDGILDTDENPADQTDSYTGGNGGSTHQYSYTYYPETIVTIDLHWIDNSFNFDVDGKTVLENGKNIDLQESSNSTNSKFVFVSDGLGITDPWTANSNGLPRVRVIVDETGAVEVYGTRDTTSTTLELMHPDDGSTYNTLFFLPGTHTLTVTNPDAYSNDGIDATNTVQSKADSDNDGIPNRFDLDSDNDGIPDNVEAQSTGSYTAPSGSDTDGDGLDNSYDPDDGGTAVPLPDTDGDGIPDYLDTDSDNDGYSDCEEGTTTGEISGNCPATNIRGDGFPDWTVESSVPDYGDINGKIDDPQDTDRMQNETGNTDEMGWREFLCGKALITLTHMQWRLISIPCNTGTNEVKDIFGDSLGNSYGTDYVLFEQTADDNYEVSDTHKNTNKTRLDANSTLEQGKSYWIIIDAGQAGNEKNVTIPKTLSNLTPTTSTDANDSTISITDPDFDKVHQHTLPDNQMTQGGDCKKYMAGNPYPYAFMIHDLYFNHGSGGYKAMGDSNNNTYILPTFYKHDSSDTSDGNVSSGGGYEAVNAGTPGFDQHGIKAMEGFFIKIEDTGSSDTNSFAYPLIMKNGNGN